MSLIPEGKVLRHIQKGILNLAGKLIPCGKSENSIECKRWLFEHENIRVTFRRIIHEIEPKRRKEFFRCFVANKLLLGIDTRRKLEAKESIHIPSSISISPTMRCNLNCIGCYAGGYPRDEEMTLSTIDKIVLEAKELGIYSISILGGEPLLRNDLFTLFESHKDVAFTLVTNGILIDDKVIDHLRNLGNVLPIISIEGFEEKTDKRRGKGVYQKVIWVMERLKEAGIIFGYSVTTTRDNLAEVGSEKFVDLMIEKGCFFGNYFLYGPVGRNPDPNLMLSSKQRVGLFEDLGNIEGTRPIIFKKEGYDDGTYFNSGCVAARNTLHVIPNGDVEPCAGTHFSMDNINEKSLREILNSPFLKAIGKHTWDHRRCFVTNEPYLLRQIIQGYNCHPTHNDAGIQLDDYCNFCSSNNLPE